MAQNDAVIIVGSLDKKELEKSIQDLVDYVGNKTNDMADKFTEGLDKMKLAMKDFAVTQKVSVDLMKEAWRNMSSSFDAMVAAQSTATGSSRGGGTSATPNSIKDLKEQITAAERLRDTFQQTSPQVAAINKQIEDMRTHLQSILAKGTLKEQMAQARKEIGNANTMSTKDLQSAQSKLATLEAIQRKYANTTILSEQQTNRLATAIENCKNKIDKLRNAKPKSLKEVLGMDASSIDAIQAKMKAIANFRLHVNADAHPQVIQRLNQEYDELHKKQLRLMGQNASLSRSNNYLAQSFGYIRNRLVYALTLGAISNFTKELFQIRGQYELMERSLGVLLDDMGKGSQIFRELNAMSLKSPFTLIDLAGAAKQLTAYNFAADEVVDTTRRLADISSALGVPMERLVYNLGQIRAQNVLNARDARDFANAGLPIVSMLADMYTEQKRFGDGVVTTANVYDMMSKKMVSYADVMQVINKVTDEGGKFFDFQAKQADTLQVQIANLNLAYNNMLNSIGKENQGVLAGSLSILKNLLLNWRQVYRVLMSLITTYGSYRAAVALVGWEHKRTFGARMLINIKQWVNGIKNAKTAMQALNATMSSNVLGLFVSALTAAVSYFWLFNNSADEMKEKLKEIQETFTSMRSNATDIFVSGLKSDNVNTQIDKLKELVSFAESELGITIPVNVQDVDAESVAQKLRDVKNDIDEYLDFAQAFSETAAGNESLNKYFTEFGNTAQSTFTNIYSSVNTVIEGLQKLADEGHASARDLEILEELVVGKKEDESKLEYLQRLVSLYEELGLIGKKVVTPDIYYARDNMKSLEEQQKKTLDRIKVHNKQVFATMLQDVQDFYSNSSIAEYQLERTVKELAERIDINSIPEDQRTLKLSAAINEEAAKNNWNDFAKQYARQVANTKFGTTIEISDESKKNTEVELKEWQKKLQSWADANGITLGITLNFDTTEVDAAKEALQNAQKAQELLAVRQRKQKVGLATQAEVDAAKQAYDEARLVAKQAGADLSSLNRKSGSGGSKKDNVLDALKDEISLVKKLQSEYDKLTKSGVMSADAIVAMQDAYGSTLRLLNKDLQKFGLPRIELSNILGKNPHEILAVFTELRNILESKGLSNLERMKVVEGVIEELKVSAKNYDMKKVTEGLNSELGKLKDEYELSLELDANPELGDMFADMFGIDTTDFPKTIDAYMQKVQEKFDKARMGLNLSESLNIFTANTEQWYNWGKAVGYSEEQVDNFKKSFDGAIGVAKKWAQDTVKQTQDLQYKLADNNGKIAIEEEKLAVLRQRLAQETNDKQKALLRLQIQDQENAIAKLKEEILQMLPTYQRLFGEIAEHSAWMTRKLARDYKNMLIEGKNRGLNADNTYSVRDPITGQIAHITKERMGKEIKNADKELQKTQSTIKKITEAFTKGEDKVVDWVHGVELISDELGKMGQLVDVVGNIADAFSNPNEYNETAEAIHDIAASLQGVSTAAKGIGQIASGDYIGGAASVLSGLATTIGAWMDNSDKKISEQVKESERAVKRLENAYKSLKDAADEAYGIAEVGAKRATIANKELQLAELRRQLYLEQSRKAKNRDEDKIEDLKGQIVDLELEIKNATNEIVNDLLNISSVGDVAENLVSQMIEAFKKGEDYMGKYADTFEDMIDNMIMKAIVGEVIGKKMEEIFKKVEEIAGERAKQTQVNAKDIFEGKDWELAYGWVKEYESPWWNDNHKGDMPLTSLTNTYEDWKKWLEWISTRSTEEGKAAYGKALENLEKIYGNLISVQPSDVEGIRDTVDNWKEGVKTEFESWMEAFGVMFGQDKEATQLSALQQGIQGVTEDTAGALEAYMNIVAQRVFEQNMYLQEIRDHLNNFDLDVQLGTLSQMLLQLQQSYQVQQNIESILTGVLNPSGRAIVVELNS